MSLIWISIYIEYHKHAHKEAETNLKFWQRNLLIKFLRQKVKTSKYWKLMKLLEQQQQNTEDRKERELLWTNQMMKKKINKIKCFKFSLAPLFNNFCILGCFWSISIQHLFKYRKIHSTVCCWMMMNTNNKVNILI